MNAESAIVSLEESPDFMAQKPKKLPKPAKPGKPRKSSKSSLILTLTAAFSLIAGGATAYWWFNQQNAPGELPLGAEAVPQEALMSVSVTTDRAQWDKLREFGTPQSQALLDQQLAQWRDRLLTANGYDYEKDVQPWVGKEVTIALLPPQTAALPPAPTDPAAPPAAIPSPQWTTIAILPIQDAAKAKQLLEQPKPQTTGKLTDRTYKGVQITESAMGTPQSFSAAVLETKLLVVTNDPKATDRAIDTYQSGGALSKASGYTQALGRIRTSDAFGKVFINLPVAASVAATNTGRPAAFPQAQQLQGLAAVANLEAEGIRFKSMSWLKPESDRKYEVRNDAKNMPERLPAETLVSTAGGNLKRFWQDYAQGATASPIGGINPDGLRQGIKSTVGMDWDKDFLPWMDGEFSLSLVGAPEGTQSIPFSLLMMVQSNDRRAAETAWKQLDQAMASKYKFKVEEAKVGNQAVTNWVLPFGGSTITHGWLDNDVTFLALGAPIATTIIPKPANSLASTEVYKKAVPTDLRPNNGYFFMNVDRAKNLPLLQLPPGNREWVAAMRSIGVTAAINDERSTRYDVFVTLQKAGKPAPLPSPALPSGS
jgi:hypothetical protein